MNKTAVVIVYFVSGRNECYEIPYDGAVKIREAITAGDGLPTLLFLEGEIIIWNSIESLKFDFE